MQKGINVFYVVVSILMISCVPKKSNTQSKDNLVSTCCQSTDGEKYNREEVLQEMAQILNELVPGWGIDKQGFYINKQCQLVGAFIWDITDTLNREATLNECVGFKEGHIYHFSPLEKSSSYSNIAILDKGRVRIFKAINCPQKGDNIEDVIRYVKDSLPASAVDESLIIRIRDYRRYGAYLGVDEQSEFICK